MAKERNSSFELLRIISMILIIFHHIARHGVETSLGMPTLSVAWVMFMTLGGKIGVNAFVMISGYFLIKDYRIFNDRKVVKIWGQIVFYSLTIYFISCVIYEKSIDVSSIIRNAMPVTNSLWWFASTYFVLFLFHPFLNKFLLSLDKKTYQIFLLLSFFCFTLISTLLNSTFQSNDFVWFIFIYSIAGYIRIFGFAEKISSAKCLFLTIIMYFVTFVFYCVVSKFLSVRTGWDTYVYQFHFQEKLLILIISLLLFIAFKNMNLKYNKFINTVAMTTFGVYLIHDNKLIRIDLMEKLFSTVKFQGSVWFVPYTFFVVIAIFTVCSLIDLGRIYLLEKPLLNFYDKYSPKYVEGLKRIIEKIRNKIFE